MERRASSSRRIANVLLSVVLVLGLMPAPAFAGETGIANDAADPAVTEAASLLTAIDTFPANDDASSESSEAEATPTPGWTQSGSCEWMIDNEGLLTVRPLGNGESGFLEDWGDYGNAPWYDYRSMIKSAVVKPGVSARTCVGMFSGCSSLTTLDLSGFDTSQVTSTGSMFSYCTSLTSLDLSSFDTSKVTSMGNMFLFCSSLSFLNLSSFDTSAVTGMLGMFYGCTSLTSLDLSSFDTSKVTSMEYMFIACKSLASLDLSSFDTSKVTNMGYMFHGCKSLASLDLSSFDTSKVTGMYKMFLGCSSLTTLDLSSFNTAKVASMSEMFSGCSSLKTIFVSRLFTTAEVKSSNYMFDGCCLLVGGAGTAYDSSFVNAARARIDGGSNAPGYFIGKHEKLDGDVNGNGALNVVDAQIAYDIATTDFYKDRQDYADMRARADVTWDNEVDAADAFAIQYAVLRGW